MIYIDNMMVSYNKCQSVFETLPHVKISFVIGKYIMNESLESASIGIKKNVFKLTFHEAPKVDEWIQQEMTKDTVHDEWIHYI